MNDLSIMPPAELGLIQFRSSRAQIAELKAHNENEVFDYGSRDGNRAARSHVAKLRKVKATIERARKAAKADAIEYGRKVDSAAKGLLLEVGGMIDFHAVPLKAIEAQGERRVANLQTCELVSRSLHQPSDFLEALQEQIGDMEPEEFEDVEKARTAALALLSDGIGAAITRELEARELETLRREKREREEREAREAEDKARAERLAAKIAAEAEQRAEAATLREQAALRQAEDLAARLAEAEKRTEVIEKPQPKPEVVAPAKSTGEATGDGPAAIVEIIAEARDAMTVVIDSYISAGSAKALEHPKLKRMVAARDNLAAFLDLTKGL